MIGIENNCSAAPPSRLVTFVAVVRVGDGVVGLAGAHHEFEVAVGALRDVLPAVRRLLTRDWPQARGMELRSN